MPTVYLSPITTIFQFLTDTGVILAGGKVNTYLAGTSTPQATYTDSTGATPNANPIILGSNGRLPNVEIWQPIGVKIKAIITDASNNTIGPTLDQLAGINDPSAIQTSFYGGTDSGSANAYILTFAPGPASYANGVVISWVPNNTNTGASTINVNGLGTIAINNPDSSALLPNQLVAGQIATIAIQGGVAILTASGNTPVNFSGTFTATLTGMTAATTGTMNYVRNGPLVTLRNSVGNIQGTSNTTGMTMTGFPANILPAVSVRAPCSDCTDNGNTNVAALVTTSSGGVFTFQLALTSGSYLHYSSNNFTSSGTKGITQGWYMSYVVT